jgi:hypothetical protein
MQFPKLLSFSNALNGMKRRESGYNLETTGMLPNFGKNGASAGPSETPTASLASTVLEPVLSRLKKCAAAAKRVLLKPEEPQPFAAPEKKSYQVFRPLSAHDAVRHVDVLPSRDEPTAEVLTDNQELGSKVQPTLLEKVAKSFTREPSQPVVGEEAAVPVAQGHMSQRDAFSATCPGRPEVNPIADAFEQRMAEKKAKAPAVVKPAAPVLHSAAKPEVKQTVPSKLREMFGRKRKVAQPAVQGEFALDNVRPIRNDLSDADLEVVSAGAKVGTGILQTATVEKANTTVTSLRESKKTDRAIDSTAEAPTESVQTPELIARV